MKCGKDSIEDDPVFFHEVWAVNPIVYGLLKVFKKNKTQKKQ
jgi:hypothetical protein